jgi:hypothetical protein
MLAELESQPLPIWAVIIIQKHTESHHPFGEMSKCQTIRDRIIPFGETVNEIVLAVMPDVE